MYVMYVCMDGWNIFIISKARLRDLRRSVVVAFNTGYTDITVDRPHMVN